MAWFKFTKDFPWAATPGSYVDYKEGMHLNIKKEAAEAAKAAGAGYLTDHRPKVGDRNDGFQPEPSAAVEQAEDTMADNQPQVEE